MKIRNSKAVRLAGAAALSTMGLASLGVAFAGPAAAAGTTTTTVPVSYSCTFPVLGATAVTIAVTTTAPTSVTVGQTASATASATLTLPSSVSGAATALGVTDIATTGASTVVIATEPGATTQTTTATLAAPFDIPVANLGNPIVANLNPVSFTATVAGTATFTPGALTLDLTINPPATPAIGGPQVVACTLSGTAPTLATVTILPKAVTPIGSVGILALAGIAGAGFIVVQRRRTHAGVQA